MMNFLFELFMEEIPARMQASAVEAFKKAFDDACAHHNVTCFDSKVMVATRRLTIMAHLSAGIPQTLEEKRGPKCTAPEQALQGFLKSVSADQSALIEQEGYWFYRRMIPERQTKDLLKEVLTLTLTTMSWPKVMRYPQSALAWVRPIRHILCLFEDEPQDIHFELLGLKSTNTTYGHRFLSSPHPIVIDKIDRYEQILEQEHVLVDQTKRRSRILECIQNACQEKGLSWVEDDALVDEVCGLVDEPFAYLLPIDASFLDLPECVLTTSMRVHQKYFAFKRGETLAPYFMVCANVKPDQPDVMKHGFQKVLNARLSDAQFFYREDLRVPLDTLTKHYRDTVYHQKLGTLEDKINRLKQHALAKDDPDFVTLIHLSKADLFTQMVQEFPELQGKMGAIYAEKQGIPKNQAIALEEYYKPLSSEDTLPETDYGCQLALMDKADAVVGFIASGLKPTGSKDPFALRRQAIGIIRILMKDRHKTVSHLIDETLKTYPQEYQTARSEILDFMRERFIHFMMSKGYSKSAILLVLDLDQDFNVFFMNHHIPEMDGYLKSSEGEEMNAFIKRLNAFYVKNHPLDVNPIYFKKEIEGEVYDLIRDFEKHKNEDKNDPFIVVTLPEDLSMIIERGHQFLDDVLIHCEDENVKKNRLSLVARFYKCFDFWVH